MADYNPQQPEQQDSTDLHSLVDQGTEALADLAPEVRDQRLDEELATNADAGQVTTESLERSNTLDEQVAQVQRAREAQGATFDPVTGGALGYGLTQDQGMTAGRSYFDTSATRPGEIALEGESAIPRPLYETHIPTNIRRPRMTMEQLREQQEYERSLTIAQEDEAYGAQMRAARQQGRVQVTQRTQGGKRGFLETTIRSALKNAAIAGVTGTGIGLGTMGFIQFFT